MEEKTYRWNLNFPIYALRIDNHPPTKIHTHNFVELVLVFGGKGKHLINNEKIDIKKGDIFVIPRGVPHGYDVYPDISLSLYDLLFIPEKLQLPQFDIWQYPIFQKLLSPQQNQIIEYSHFSITEEETDELSSLFNELIKECEIPLQATQTCKIALFMLLLCRLARKYYKENSYSKINEHKQAIVKTLEYIDKHYKENHSVESLAKYTNMSPSNFVKYFKITTGCAPLQYILKSRLHFACRMLLSTEIPVTEIAFKSGFNNSNYFTRLFTKHLGCTPREYRKKNNI